MRQDFTIMFRDGHQRSVPQGAIWADVVGGLKTARAQGVLAIRVDGALKDLTTRVDTGATVEAVTFDSPQGREVYRHSSAHVMAQAVKALFPGTRLAIGPAIENGFYYDFACSRPLTPEDLEKIEGRMREIIEADLPFERSEIPREEAMLFFQRLDEPFKVELLREFTVNTVSLYQQGKFVDLCEGPHLPSTGWIKAVKLLSLAGAYWRGDERNPMLQRLYGTSFPSRGELEAHLHRLEEAKRRDHRKLGKELDLFSIEDELGPGLILWHPKGATVRRVIEELWKVEHIRAGYELVYTPHLAKRSLWERSGHTEFYREGLYPPVEVEGTPYQVKPMNCPFHIQIYKTHLRSYRDLPIRYAELGTVYRFERSGVLHGLFRVRGFTQDDAHIFCRPEEMSEEILAVLGFTERILGAFGFTEYEVRLSTRPPEAVGAPALWETATTALADALGKKGWRYEVDPGEGVFYGPKIDLKIKDVLGRTWQCATVQVDFNLPERFHLTYIGEDGREHQPVMVHRALLGSLERFVGILIEHYAGAFPPWLAPVQAKVVPVADRHASYAATLTATLKDRQIRVETDCRQATMGLKVRDAQVAKVPYILVVGDREMANGTVSVRRRREDLGVMMVEHAAALLQTETAPPLSSQ